MNTTRAVFGGSQTIATAQTVLWQYDYGQILLITGLDLPSTYQVHFCNDGDSTTVQALGDGNGVEIPDALLQTGRNVNAYIYLHTGDDDGETEYKINIVVRKRPQPTDIEPTPVQQDIIDRAIAVLNSAVEQTAEDAEATNAAKELALAAQDSAEQARDDAIAANNRAVVAETNASQSATSAGASAVSASQSAGAAHIDAERAEQAANMAGYLDVEIVNGRLVYTRTDAVDVNFSLENGRLMMEAI